MMTVESSNIIKPYDAEVDAFQVPMVLETYASPGENTTFPTAWTEVA